MAEKVGTDWDETGSGHGSVLIKNLTPFSYAGGAGDGNVTFVADFFSFVVNSVSFICPYAC